MSVTGSPGKRRTRPPRRKTHPATRRQQEAPGTAGGFLLFPRPIPGVGLLLPGAGEEARGEFVVQFSVEVAFQVTAVTLGEFLRNGVRNCDAFGYCHAVADLTE